MKLDLAAIKGRYEKATPGLWIESDGGIKSVDEKGDSYIICRHYVSLYDRKFIAHARSDIPALVAEVERLVGALDDHGSQVETCSPKEGAKTCACGYLDALSGYLRGE